MKFQKKYLERLVNEELVKFISSSSRLDEAPRRRPATLDLPEDEPPTPDRAPEEEKPTVSPSSEAGADVPLPDEKPPGEDDVDLDQPPEGEDDVAGEDEPEAGSIAKEIQGKRIAAISMDAKSKITPGSTEIVLTFEDLPDALRILITKTGIVKFFFRGLHNDLGILPASADDEGEGDLDEVPPMGDEDMPPEDEPPAEEPPLDEVPPEEDPHKHRR